MTPDERADEVARQLPLVCAAVPWEVTESEPVRALIASTIREAEGEAEKTKTGHRVEIDLSDLHQLSVALNDARDYLKARDEAHAKALLAGDGVNYLPLTRSVDRAAKQASLILERVEVEDAH